MKLHQTLLPVVLSLFVLGAGCSFTQTVSVNRNVSTQTSENENANTASQPVTYTGVEGKTALELLQAEHQVEVSDQGFVNAIDGVKPGEREYWAFYVNDKLAEVGAKDYQTKNDEQIEWKLESF